MDSLVGITIRNYQIMGNLGNGGMAEVYVALNTSDDRFVAIKFIRPELSLDPGFRARFEREAGLVARMRHDNIVRIFDFGEYQSRYYLVMEFVHGVTLKTHIQNLFAAGTPPTLEEIISIGTQVGEALEYVHRAGIVHRDVKPENILVTTDGRALLNDFGVARIVGLEGEVTASGTLIGTPAYMSPEHILSDGKHISPASDIYALGVILYELVTGRPPFRANSPILMMIKHLNEPVPVLHPFRTALRQERPVPSEHPLPSERPLPDGMDAIIQKALAKDPAERFPSAADFVNALREVLEQTLRLSRVIVEPAII